MSFVNCGFFPSGAGLNYLAMQANPSQCSVNKTTGAVECACKRDDLAGPGYCQRECDLVVGVSWPRVAGMLMDFRQNLTHNLEAHRGRIGKDGTQVIAKMAGDEGADEEDTGVGHPTIVALVCVAAFAVVAVAVINIQRVRESKDLAVRQPHFYRAFSAPIHPTLSVCRCLVVAHTDWELIGACNPML